MLDLGPGHYFVFIVCFQCSQNKKKLYLQQYISNFMIVNVHSKEMMTPISNTGMCNWLCIININTMLSLVNWLGTHVS